MATETQPPNGLDRQDWVLLALAAAGGEPLNPAQLQKSLFLLGERMKAQVGPGFYEFSAYHYGPFNASVYHDAQRLAEQGLVHITVSPQGRYRQYAITVKGLNQANQIEAEAGKAGAYLRKAVTWAMSLNFDELINAIYREFPQYKANSIYKGA